MGRTQLDHSDYDRFRLALVSHFGWSRGRQVIAAFAEIICRAFP
jgi:hypothetical protein